MTDTFEKLLREINEVSKAADKKIYRAKESSAAQDIVEMGPFRNLDSAYAFGVLTEEDQKYFVDTGEILTKNSRAPKEISRKQPGKWKWAMK